MAARPRALIITALGLETDAVLDQLEDVKVSHDGPLPVRRGSLRCDPTWEVVVVEAGANNLNAATYATAAVVQYRPAVTMFVGVCGGFEVEGVKEFDLVVPPDVHYYGLGAAEEQFEHRSSQRPVSRYALDVAKTVAGNDEWQQLAPDDAAGHSDVRFEPLASGDHVVKSLDSATYALIRRISSKIVAVDMEASGFLTATGWWQPTHPLVVRCVSDLVSDKDPEKDLERQPQAAIIAAAFASGVLRALSESRELTVVDELANPGSGDHASAARVLVAELDQLLCVDQWHRITEGLFWADPPKWWKSFDDCLLEAIAFLRARTPIPGAPEIDAAFANLLNVLVDLRDVLQKDADPLNSPDAFWMRKYYRDAYNDPKLNQWVLGEQWAEECRLAKNLAAEATRAINLVHERIRAKHDPNYRVVEGLVGVFVGVDDTFLPVLYSREEAGADEPYPGLDGFPAALEGREIVFQPLPDDVFEEDESLVEGPL